MKFHAAEAVALVFLAITVVITVAGPFYYNSVVAASQQQGASQVFHVTAEQWVFVPDKFVVTQGEKVTFILTSADVVHGFSIKGYNVGVIVYPGRFSQLTIVASMAGTFNIICFVNCGTPFLGALTEGHSSMNATLVVLPS